MPNLEKLNITVPLNIDQRIHYMKGYLEHKTSNEKPPEGGL
jgi:hypothetical protein